MRSEINETLYFLYFESICTTTWSATWNKWQPDAFVIESRVIGFVGLKMSYKQAVHGNIKKQPQEKIQSMINLPSN